MAFNQSDPSSTRTSLSSSDTAMLEALVPGYTLISRFFLSYLQIDLTAYLQYFVVLALFGASLRYLTQYISGLCKEYLVSTAEIRLDDEIFNYFMYWMSRQPHMKRTNRFVAGVKTNGYWSEDEDSDSEDEREFDEVDEPGSGSDAGSFDEYWAKVVTRDKYKPLRFTPSQGRHFFWYKGQPLMLERQHQNQTARWVLNNERLYLSCIGRDATILKDLLAEAQQVYVERDGNRTVIYRGRQYSLGGSFSWGRCMARSPRPLSTVVLDHEQKQAFIEDLKEYLHPRTRRWYSNRGIPYRRGYLLHGPPGTGKTSLCFAAAGLLGLKLFLLNLNSKALDEDNLSSLFSDLPHRCIVLLEDVDTAGITHRRGKTVADAAKEKEKAAQMEVPEDPSDDADQLAPIDASRGDGITLSGLLNVIDGVAASEGRILIMTTNHPEKLDAALLRPGRVDMSIAFEYTSQKDIEELFASIYMTMEGDLPRQSASRRLSNCQTQPTANGTTTHPQQLKRTENQEMREKNAQDAQDRLDSLHSRITALSKQFATVVPTGEFTAAEIQGYLLNYKNTPEDAIQGADAWVQALREKKRAREEKAV